MVFLDFEKPLEKLYEQLEKIKQVEEEGTVDMSETIKELEKQITKELLIAGVKQLLWGGIPGTILGGALGFAMGTVMGVGIEEIVILSLTTVIIIGTIVLLATYLPTKKALQLEPSEALHHE